MATCLTGGIPLLLSNAQLDVVCSHSALLEDRINSGTAPMMPARLTRVAAICSSTWSTFVSTGAVVGTPDSSSRVSMSPARMSRSRASGKTGAKVVDAQEHLEARGRRQLGERGGHRLDGDLRVVDGHAVAVGMVAPVALAQVHAVYYLPRHRLALDRLDGHQLVSLAVGAQTLQHVTHLQHANIPPGILLQRHELVQGPEPGGGVEDVSLGGKDVFAVSEKSRVSLAERSHLCRASVTY